MYKKITISVLLIQLLGQITIQAMQKVSSQPFLQACELEELGNLRSHSKLFDLLQAAELGNLTDTMRLLREGVDPNASVPESSTPLFMAAQAGHANIVNILLRRHVDVNKAKNDGSTPLAAAAENGHLKAVRALLVAANIEVNKATNDGCTPLYVAAANGHLSVSSSTFSCRR